MSPFLQFAISFCIILRFAIVKSVIFGLHTPESWTDHSDASDSIVVLTLYWGDQMYQCNVYPKNKSTEYMCDTLNEDETLKCDVSLSSTPITYGIQIDNDDWDHAVIDKVVIRKDNTWSKVYEMTRFCFNASCSGTLTLFNDYYLFPFNISKTSLSVVSNVILQNQSARCTPDGFICNNSNNCTFVDKYKLVPIKKTWWNAQGYCHDKLNSTLATITSKEDLQIAVAIRDNNDMYFANDIWIGYTDSSVVSSENKWKWVDTRPCDYSNNNSCSQVFWAPGEPNNEHNDINGGEDCVEIKHQYTFGLFNDIDCTEERMFFCNNPDFIQKTVITTTQSINSTTTQSINSTESSALITRQTYHKYIMLIVIIMALIILIITICICCCFYYKRYIKQQVKKQTIGNQTTQQDIQYDVQPGSQKTFQMFNDIDVSPKSFDGYNMVKKSSIDHDTDEEDAKEVVIVHNTSIAKRISININDHIEGYVDETKIAVMPIILMENIVNQDIYSSSNNESDDMYDDTLIVQEKNTPTVKDEHIMGYGMIGNEVMDNEEKENEQQSSNDDIYQNPNDNPVNDITIGNVDSNTIGNVINED